MRYVAAGMLSWMLFVTAGALGQEQRNEPPKMRILVDKVMQPEAHWKTEEWMVRETAEAHFTVYSPRCGYDDLAAVTRVTEWCAKYGLTHLPWMRGSLDVALDNAAANGKRLVWANGHEQPLWSPNSDEFWEWTTRYIVEYAKLSVDNRALRGVFLDYENYAPGKEDNLYSLSYDADILKRFAVSAVVDIPDIAPAARKAWLEEHALHERFAAFQIQHWRDRCRALRVAVDQFNPTFQFCVYPAPGTPFMVEAVYREWATERAPLMLADASTYGRPSEFISDRDGLDKNRVKLDERMTVPLKAQIPFVYLGGIDPVVRGADPEFCGKNAVAISEKTAGYWIFYEGPSYTKQDHRDYWKWFTWANEMIAKGRFDAYRQDRETPESWIEPVFDSLKLRGALAFPESMGEKVEYPAAKLRGTNFLLIAGKSGVPVGITLRHEPVAAYVAQLDWAAYSPAKRKLATGTIPQGASGIVSFTPDMDGIHVIMVSAGTCALQVTSSNAPLAVYAGKRASFIGPASKLYFSVATGTERFAVHVRSDGNETVRVDVFDSQGTSVSTAQTTPDREDADVAVEVKGRSCGVWALEAMRADVGTIEDYGLALEGLAVPGLSLSPQHVIGSRP